MGRLTDTFARLRRETRGGLVAYGLYSFAEARYREL